MLHFSPTNYQFDRLVHRVEARDPPDVQLTTPSGELDRDHDDGGEDDEDEENSPLVRIHPTREEEASIDADIDVTPLLIP